MRKNKFKVGDTVRLTQERAGLQKGTLCLVMQLDDSPNVGLATVVEITPLYGHWVDQNYMTLHARAKKKRSKRKR